MKAAAMQDITPIIEAFRETARHVWNSALKENATWDDRDDFDDLCAVLFRAMIVRPVGMPNVAIPPGRERHPWALPFLVVVPRIEHGTQIRINRTPPSSGYWDDPVSSVVPNEIDLRFVRFFD